MEIRQTLKKRMEGVEASGLGRFYKNASEGEVVFSADLESGTLDVYVDGFTYKQGSETGKVGFSEVLSIVSCLTAQLFSSAGQSGKLEFYLPLDVKCKGRDLSLFLPFLSYSRVMIVLVEFRERWEEGFLSVR